MLKAKDGLANRVAKKSRAESVSTRNIGEIIPFS